MFNEWNEKFCLIKVFNEQNYNFQLSTDDSFWKKHGLNVSDGATAVNVWLSLTLSFSATHTHTHTISVHIDLKRTRHR